MLIKSTSVSIKYQKIENIKRTYFLNEELLKKQFNEATVLPIPDDAPIEIPRIIVKSLHEHSQLNITPVAATLQINYNEGFEKDWASCEKYINDKMSLVFEFLNSMTNNKYDYVGMVTEVLMDEIVNDGAKILSANLLKTHTESEIYDLNVRYTFVEKNNIFVNISLQNARLFKEGTVAENPGQLASKNQIAESIGAVIDVNDRYGFNCQIDYNTSSDKLHEIMNEMSDIINKKLDRLIEKGEY